MGLIGNAFTAVTGISKGDVTQKMLQFLGMPKQMAAMAGAMTDYKSGNLVGMHQNLTEGLTGTESSGFSAAGAAMIGKMTGMGAGGTALMAVAQSVGRPGSSGGGGTAALGLATLVGGGLLLGRAAKGATAEGRAGRSSGFAALAAAAAGGSLLLGSGSVGALAVAGAFSPLLSGIMPGVGGMLTGAQKGGVIGGLNQMSRNITGLATGLGYAGRSAFMGRKIDPGEMRIRANARPDGELAKLPTPATFEDLIAAFMIDIMKDMQDEMKQKMTEYEKMKPTNNTNQQSKGPVGGLFGGLGSVLGGIPIVGGLFRAVGGMFGLGGGVNNAANQSTAMGQSKGQATDEDSRQILFEKIKDLMQKMQQMFQSLSNVLNTMHQGAMNSIRNIRA